MIPYKQIIAVAAIVAFLGALYLFAYDKGYQKHKMETESQATQVIVSSREDLINAVEEVRESEKNIKDTVECNDIFNFDLTVCLSK